MEGLGDFQVLDDKSDVYVKHAFQNGKTRGMFKKHMLMGFKWSPCMVVISGSFQCLGTELFLWISTYEIKWTRKKGSEINDLDIQSIH